MLASMAVKGRLLENRMQIALSSLVAALLRQFFSTQV
jgi:hypothetical protein